MTTAAPRRDGTCFFEADPSLSLARRAAAEGLGALFLACVVVSAGLVWASETGLGAIGRAIAVGPTLAGLILLFGTVSGGHFNPLISLSQTLLGRREIGCLVAYVAAQVAGAVLGAGLAVWMCGRSLPVGATPMATVLGSEAFATTGLMTLVIAAPRMRPAGVGPFAVGGWIAMTIVGLPAGPAANPAITLALLAVGGASRLTTVAHLTAQAVGLALALGAYAVTAPRPRGASA